MNTKQTSSSPMIVAIREALRDILASDKRYILIGEDIGLMGGAFGASRSLQEKFDEQVLETPICENTIIGLAIGMAMNGLRPIVEIMFMDFIMLAMDQIINHLTKMYYMYGNQFTLPVVIRTAFGAKGGYGASHSQALESLFIGIPGLQVVVPSDSVTARGLLLSAAESDNPILFLEHKTLYSKRFTTTQNIKKLPLHNARLVRDGNEILIISYGNVLWKSIKAADELEMDRGISCAVLDLVSLKPIDWKTIQPLVEKIGKIVVVEEGHIIGGVGAEIAALISEFAWDSLDGPVVRVGLPDCPIPSSRYLEEFVLPTLSTIKVAILKALES